MGRKHELSGMAGFAKAVAGTSADYWWSEGNQVAIGRQGKGFFVATNLGGLDRTFSTSMPAGAYCNVIQGCPTTSGCEGDTIHVDGSGNARFVISDGSNPMAAIHVGENPVFGSFFYRHLYTILQGYIIMIFVLLELVNRLAVPFHLQRRWLAVAAVCGEKVEVHPSHQHRAQPQPRDHHQRATRELSF